MVGNLRKVEGVVEGVRVTNYEEIECMLCTKGNYGFWYALSFLDDFSGIIYHG